MRIIIIYLSLVLLVSACDSYVVESGSATDSIAVENTLTPTQTKRPSITPTTWSEPTATSTETATPTPEPKPTKTATPNPTATPIKLLSAVPVVESQVDLQKMNVPLSTSGQIETQEWLRLPYADNVGVQTVTLGYEFDGTIDDLPLGRIVIYDPMGNELRSYDEADFDRENNNRATVTEHFGLICAKDCLERVIQFELEDRDGYAIQTAGKDGEAVDPEKITVLLTRNRYDESDNHIPQLVPMVQFHSLYPKFIFRGEEEVYKVSEGTMSHTFSGNVMEFLSVRSDLQKTYEFRDLRDNLLFTMEDLFANPDRSIPEEYLETVRGYPFMIKRVLPSGEREDVLFFENGLVYDVGVLANGYYPFVSFSGLVSDQQLVNVAQKFGRSMQDEAIRKVYELTQGYYGGSSFAILAPKSTFLSFPPFNRGNYRTDVEGISSTGSENDRDYDDMPFEPYRKIFYHPGVFIVDSQTSLGTVVHEFGHVVWESVLKDNFRVKVINFHIEFDKSGWFYPYISHQGHYTEYWAELVSAWSVSTEIPDMFSDGVREFTREEYLDQIDPSNTFYTFAHDTFQQYEFYNWFYDYFGPPGMGFEF